MDMMSLRRRVMVNQNKLMTATGNPITFHTPLDKPLKECVVRFTPQQEGSGTPSPENVREIVGRSSITVYQQGGDGITHETSVSFPSVTKNLLDSTKRKDGYYIDATGKEIANAQFGYTTAYTPVEPNETYVLSGNIGNLGSAYGAVYCYDENKNFVDRQRFWSNTLPHTFVVPSNTRYVNFQYYKVLKDVQLEKGSTATAYEPFDSTVYGGYVDLVNGEVVAEWTKVDMGERNWAFGWGTFHTAPSNFTGNGASGTQTEAICDIYPSDVCRPASAVGETDKTIRGRANYKHICIRDDDYTTAADFKTAVTGHYLAYKLAEPIHYSLIPQSIATLKGVNTMWSDANGDISVKYWTR